MKQNKTVIMFILFVSGLVIMMNLYLTIPLTKSISSLFQISSNQASLLSSLFSLGFALGCLVYGVLSEKFGRKNVIIRGILALTLVTFLIGINHSFSIILGLRFIQGICAASFSPVALAFAGEYFENNQKTTAIGLISTGFLMAGILGQTYATTMFNLFSFQTVFLGMSVLLVICSLFLFFILPSTEPKNANLPLIKSYSNIRSVISNISLICSYVIAFFLLMTFVIMSNLLMNKLTLAPFNLTANQQLQIRFLSLIGMLFSPLAGKISAKIGVSSLLTYSLLLTIFTTLLTTTTNNLYFITALNILFIMGIALAVPSLVSLVNIFGAFERGLAVSIYTFILFLGTSLAPYITQAILMNFSTNQGFYVLGMIIVIPTLVSLIIKKKLS